MTVVFGRPKRDAEDENAVVNPTVLVEVTSRRTEAYDGGEKFEHYRTIPALREYVIVSHREPRIDVWRRPESGGEWIVTQVGSGQVAPLDAIGSRLDVDHIYAATRFPE